VVGVTVRKRTLLAGAVAFAVVAVLGVVLGLHHWDGRLPLRLGPSCTVQAEKAAGETGGELQPVELDPDQMANAATIAAVGIRRGMPQRAVVVALATAFQESKLRNLPNGDRDSIGLFQQRPSKGWGTPEQIRDPRYAAGKFYDALRKVRGWETMQVTEAAQRVQRSAHPTAYEKWADDSTVLATALFGQATGAVACALRDEPAVRGAAAATGLTQSLSLDWGQLDAVTSAAARQPGLTLAVHSDRAGWQYAHWLVSHAADRGVKRVSFADRQWTAKDGSWTKVDGAKAAAAGRVVAEVFADQGQ
jgi:hypothetical protein